jgi:hypothetical protein
MCSDATDGLIPQQEIVFTPDQLDVSCKETHDQLEPHAMCLDQQFDGCVFHLSAYVVKELAFVGIELVTLMSTSTRDHQLGT